MLRELPTEQSDKMRAVRAALLIGAVSATFFASCLATARAVTPVVKLTIASGSPVTFVPTNITNGAFPADGTMTVDLTITTTATGGGGGIALSAPTTLTATNGSTLDPALISFTCKRGTAGSWFIPGGTVTLVPGGITSACATFQENVNNQSGTFIITFTINDLYNSISPLVAATWPATSGFTVSGEAL